MINPVNYFKYFQKVMVGIFLGSILSISDPLQATETIKQEINQGIPNSLTLRIKILPHYIEANTAKIRTFRTVEHKIQELRHGIKVYQQGNKKQYDRDLEYVTVNKHVTTSYRESFLYLGKKQEFQAEYIDLLYENLGYVNGDKNNLIQLNDSCRYFLSTLDGNKLLYRKSFSVTKISLNKNQDSTKNAFRHSANTLNESYVPSSTEGFNLYPYGGQYRTGIDLAKCRQLYFRVLSIDSEDEEWFPPARGPVKIERHVCKETARELYSVPQLETSKNG